MVCIAGNKIIGQWTITNNKTAALPNQIQIKRTYPLADT
jgi:hypothetical protein